jgi:hypothetical protein
MTKTTYGFVEERLQSMRILLNGTSDVIIDHDYQAGKLISIFSKRNKDDNELIVKICRKASGDYPIRESLDYNDSDNSCFDGFRLRYDMILLGFTHLYTFRPGWDCMDIPSIRIASEYTSKDVCDVVGALYINSSGASCSSEVAKAYFEEIMRQLIDNIGFKRFQERDLYKVIDSGGNVPTGHPRVCQVAQGTFVSHPTCKKCGSHSGRCCQFRSFKDAVIWANRKNITCWNCLSERTKARIEKKMEEGGDYEPDDYDGYSCSCPLEGDSE